MVETEKLRTPCNINAIQKIYFVPESAGFLGLLRINNEIIK
jgi:hypothetical protein